ncbi:putative membrane-associated protein [Desulfosporosinus orientis DSM 765]|uniref:Putative membrane-associated protein n=1 Tax=Desulfosporosinus orientis (strain ATCC 19365 / DSM 765 / NCIMB 8382 / VKM B-1628 / Singapore I) TaxID=768706 RepID=G7WAZ3_DESOD|nr:DedA family protein [Desulfosporosinus orientis]AET67494.1 putative membrane-associated protein [Desulfosporosinus orientis DSM 765]
MSFEVLTQYITQYGYPGLFLIMAISILGIPIPDEVLLTFIGFLTYSGRLNPILAVIFSALGSSTSITIEYLLGRFFHRLVSKLLNKHARLEKILYWYQRHGAKLLTAGYFIPGVRHISGYIAGLSKLEYRKFAAFAYLGAALWTTLFITLGRLLGSKWNVILPIIHRYALILGLIAVILALAFYLLHKYHDKLGNWLFSQLQKLPERYLSLGKRRFIFTVGGLLFLILFIYFMGLIQDFVTYEVGPADDLVVDWVTNYSPYFIISFMQIINSFGTHLFILIFFIIAGGMLRYTTKRWSHIVPLSLAWMGGTVIDSLFRLVFKGYGIRFFENLTPFQAPSQGFLIAALTFYAVLGYLVGKTKSKRTMLFIGITEFFFLILLALSPIFLRIHPPSTMVMSLTVSGLLTLICLFVYEFRASYFT